MNKTLKRLLIAAGSLVVLFIVALLLIPSFVNVEKYKPEIEQKVSEATGRPFAIRGHLSLSLFPWAGISLSDLHLGNPPGFTGPDFLSVKSFEVRVKLLPLLYKDIRVKRFILEGPQVVLERNKSGRANWEGLGKPAEGGPPVSSAPAPGKAPESQPKGGLPIKNLAVGEFTVSNGSILWIDQTKGERREISDVNLRLRDVSLDRPIRLAFSAKVDGNPLELNGSIGPLGKDPGRGIVPVDLKLQALKDLEMDLKGQVVDATTRRQFDLTVQIPRFSPRKLVQALGRTFPVNTADPSVLNAVALKARLKGSAQNVSVSDGILNLDDSKLTFSAQAKDFSKPDVAFLLDLDQMDLDRYLPPPGEKKPAEGKGKEAKAPAPEISKKKTNYGPLRRLVLDGTIKIAKLKVHGARLQDLLMKVSGRNGLFQLDPLSLKLYRGSVSSRGSVDVSRDEPRTALDLQISGVQVNPLLKDVLKKDFLSGTLKGSMKISTAGDDAAKLKSALNGNGDFLFSDGAITGIDLAGMVRNAEAAFGLVKAGGGKPRTDFSAFHFPFTITKGVMNTSGATLVSPLLRVQASGKADLNRETLDFRVEPKIVATLKGQGDVQQRGGISVPVLVSGTFSAPSFRPDLKGMLRQTLEKGIPNPSELEKDKGKVNDLLKKLPFGR